MCDAVCELAGGVPRPPGMGGGLMLPGGGGGFAGGGGMLVGPDNPIFAGEQQQQPLPEVAACI